MNDQENKPLTPADVSDSLDDVGKSLTKEGQDRPKVSTAEACRQRNRQVKRVPLHEQSLLEFEKDPRFHYHEVIDRKDQLERYKRAGYSFKERKDGTEAKTRSKDASIMGKYISRIVGRDKTGDIRAFIMQIPIELYKKDQAAKMKSISNRMHASTRKIPDVPDKQAYGKVEIEND